MKKLLFSITALSLTFYANICMAESAADQMHSANVDGLAASKYYKEVHEGEAKELTELKSPVVHEAGKDNRGEANLNGDLEKMRTEAGYNFDTKSPIKKEPIGAKIVKGYVYEKNGKQTEMLIGDIPPVSAPEDVDISGDDGDNHKPPLPPVVHEHHLYVDEDGQPEKVENNQVKAENIAPETEEKTSIWKRMKNYVFGEGKDNPTPRTLMKPAPEAMTPQMEPRDDISYWCDALQHQNDSDEECHRCCMENLGEMNGYGKCGGHLDENHVCQCDWVQLTYTGPEPQYPSLEAQCQAEYPEIYGRGVSTTNEETVEFSFTEEDFARAKAKTEVDEAKLAETEKQQFRQIKAKAEREEAQKCGEAKNASLEYCKLCCYSSYFKDSNYNPMTQKISDAKIQNGSCVCYWESREFNPCDDSYSAQSDQNCTQCCFSKFFHNDNFNPNTHEMTHGKVVNGNCRCSWNHKETEEEKVERERREEEQQRRNLEYARQVQMEYEDARQERDAEWQRRNEEFDREWERQKAKNRHRRAEEERQREWEEQQEALRRKQEEALHRRQEEAENW